MKAGLWIDHKRAVIATVAGREVDLREITFHPETLVRHVGATCNVQADDRRDRRVAHHLNRYYDEIVDAVRNAESIWVTGPGEAKTEFAARLDHAGLAARIDEVRAADKMTDREFMAMVRDRYLPRKRRRR